MKIMLVEDEEMLSAIVAKGLRKVGYAVDTVFDGEEALVYYEMNEYDMIVLDLNIPKIDGLDVLRAIRKKDTDTKILILSARAKIDERILGLDEGANDYLIKPFDFGELEARIRNLLRRNFSVTPATIMLSSFMIDTNAKKVICNNEALNLTRKEYNIFEYLILNKNKIVSAEQLVEHIWDSEFDPFSNTLRYHIHTLKKKLSDFSDKEVIKTIRGQGYIIEDAQ
ncbi:DNA-binding response regulator, OmpR family, contains REC and winged-helix (wHTH) domain [Evansella caseinilytica]|uniref:DNA-binding response regulator, OmpR family, contains REC and winged-helix (WHTH) domain n=1 Tax=Evansella caseinilytica TaxID=1503961 RepID=A0A1H3TRI5_9BACI|nr:response regulator transcription factor [Evansella caseinilytica]SDZ51939.1 DNA-binding response regulator, OmpR family, contains REC and winged-helix (wHTH) domain [Evansella caseinilytica]